MGHLYLSFSETGYKENLLYMQSLFAYWISEFNFKPCVFRQQKKRKLQAYPKGVQNGCVTKSRLWKVADQLSYTLKVFYPIVLPRSS